MGEKYPKELILVQHCQSQQHLNNMVGGWTDWPLTERGKKQAGQIARKIKEDFSEEGFNLFSSDLVRAIQTSAVIGDFLGKDPIIRSNFREIHVGVATGKTKKWAEKHEVPPAPDKSLIDHRPFPGGETLRELYLRLEKGISSLPSGKNIVVSHGVAMTSLIAIWLKIPVTNLNCLDFKTSPGGITHLVENGQGRRILQALNIIEYLS